RWLAPDGVLVCGSVDPSAAGAPPNTLSYERFFDLLITSFAAVRMIGQAPFRAWSIVDFAPRETELTFDGSLCEGAGQGPVRYLAICAAQDVILDAYAVIQIPGGEPEPVEEGPPLRPDLEARLRAQQDAVDAAGVHAEGLER